MKKTTKTELAYTAGIIDGEGSLSIGHDKRNSTYFPIVEVTNTDVQMINALRKFTVLGRIYSRPPRKSGRKGLWVWHVRVTTDVLILLSVLTPYLITKKERAKVMCQFCVCKTKVTIHPTILEFYYQKMKSLNMFGS